MAYREFIGEKVELEKHKRRSWPKPPNVSDTTLLVLFWFPTILAIVLILAYAPQQPPKTTPTLTAKPWSACIQVDQYGRCVVFR